MNNKPTLQGAQAYLNLNQPLLRAARQTARTIYEEEVVAKMTPDQLVATHEAFWAARIQAHADAPRLK